MHIRCHGGGRGNRRANVINPAECAMLGYFSTVESAIGVRLREPSIRQTVRRPWGWPTFNRVRCLALCRILFREEARRPGAIVNNILSILLCVAAGLTCASASAQP